ncbi:hypothetical protein FPQ18DRAFT_307116 [Pyronema domesticum]|nr:hypothetical protein FPQ18DRAFT_307116 [Pyronema domesticum]
MDTFTDIDDHHSSCKLRNGFGPKDRTTTAKKVPKSVSAKGSDVLARMKQVAEEPTAEAQAHIVVKMAFSQTTTAIENDANHQVDILSQRCLKHRNSDSALLRHPNKVHFDNRNNISDRKPRDIESDPFTARGRLGYLDVTFPLGVSRGSPQVVVTRVPDPANNQCRWFQSKRKGNRLAHTFFVLIITTDSMKRLFCASLLNLQNDLHTNICDTLSASEGRFRIQDMKVTYDGSIRTS